MAHLFENTFMLVLIIFTKCVVSGCLSVCVCVLVCPMSLLNESALNSAVHMELSWMCPLELKVVGYLRSRQCDISLCCVVK